MSTERKKKKGVFYVCYAIFCALLVFALSCGIGVFYDFIREYERCLPEHVANAYITSLDNESFAELVGPELISHASGFETDDALGSALSSAISGGVTYTECVGESVPAYDVYCGGKLMKVKLKEVPGGRYGFARYEVATAEIYPEWFDERFSSVTVIVPDGSVLTLNGIEVGSDRKDGKEYKSATLSAFDRSLPKLVEYEVDSIFGDVDIAAQFRGEELNISRLGESSTYYSDYDLPSRFDYSIKAPLKAKITVNGVDVSSDYMTNTEHLSGVSTEFEPDTAPEIATYSLKGLLDVPEVSVSLEGQALTPSASDTSHSEYSYPDSYRHYYTVRVPRGMKLFCNGIEVGESYATGEKYTCPPPSSANGAKTTETCVVYSVGVYNEPTFTVSSEGAVAERDGDVFTFLPVPNSSEDKDIREISQKFTELFVKYATEDGGKAQENYDAFIGYVLSKSDAYNIITTTLSSMIYNSPFKVTSLDTKIYDLVKYSDDCISVKVDFKSHAKYYRYEKDSNGTYEMVWVKKSGSWKLCGFTM